MSRAWVIGCLIVAALFQTARAEEARPKHHIVYVHGFGGDENTFGAMPWYLVAELQKQQPEYEFHSHYFHYGKTFDDNSIDIKNLGTIGIKENFAQYLGDFIDEKVKDVQPEDRISIITHSQGGLIATIWIYNAALSDQPKYHAHLKNNLYSFITIGTPFWGSKLASLYTEPTFNPLKFFAKGIMALMFDDLDKIQLRDMSFASDSLREFRKNMALIPDDKLKELKSQVRFLNIGGVAQYDQDEGKYFQLFGGKYSQETDVAVSLPASQINTISFTDFKNNYEEGYRSSIGKTKVKRLADTYISKGFHSPIFEGVPEKAIAAIPAACKDVNSSECDHDIYKVIIDYLQGKDVPKHHPDINPELLLGFTLELIVKLPKDLTETEIDDIKSSISVEPLSQVTQERLNEDPNAKYFGRTGRIILSDFWEPLSLVKVFRPSDKIIPFNSLHVRMTGLFDMDYEKDKDLLRGLQAWGDILTLEISGEGYKSRVIDFPIKPTYSIDLMVNLERSLHKPSTRHMRKR